ncbi:hypothetical protein [Sphingomonas sp. KC8]|uniref:hypothetical protein n=1 Tax=Sphingomonas sp. KC8 TaxID=1030157 RepID=UPI000248A459|nr:hypothetical protein [Sphingomonas sp. KC8]ARS27050.1 hypothetical protein KC8_07070 [Sphingomonas sp. KC8]
MTANDLPHPHADGANHDMDAHGAPVQPLGVSDIVQRLQTPITNPVTRARLRVEQEVPEARRGPGWDRHWRELEAYVELPGEWSGSQE